MGRLIAYLAGLGGFLFIIIGVVFAFGAVLWPYVINTWLIYAGKEPCLEWWMGGLMAFVPGAGQVCLPAAFITFILMMFL